VPRWSRTPAGELRRGRVACVIGTWLVLTGVVLGEVRDPPLDLVRVLVHLVLAVLMTWFLTSILAWGRADRD
jgi:hypothetical protein